MGVRPATVNRVLSEAGLMKRNTTKSSKKGTGFVQPLKPHQYWHLDIAYLNIRGTFDFIASLLDGSSRCIVHWEIWEKMEEVDIEAIVQRAREKKSGSQNFTLGDHSLPCEGDEVPLCPVGAMKSCCARSWINDHLCG